MNIIKINVFLNFNNDVTSSDNSVSLCDNLNFRSELVIIETTNSDW